MTRLVCAVAVLALGACSLPALAQADLPSSQPAQQFSGLQAATTATSASNAHHAAGVLLAKRIASVDWLDMPFEEVIAWLRAESEGQVNIIPRWGPLSVESVDRDTLVTLQLNSTMVAEVLNEVLAQLSEDGALRYQATGNKLKISTRTDFDRTMHVRIYDVTDILFRVPDFGKTAPIIDLQRTGGAGGAGGGGGGQSVFSGSSSGSDQDEAGEQAEQNLRERLEELRTLIEETIAPDTWDTGDIGGRGRIRIFNRALVVYNTIEVHEQIAGSFALGG